MISPATPVLATSPCPCGTGKPYSQCCEPLIVGHDHAANAEQLMRSRYSAHAVAKQEPAAIDYLLQTWAPEQRQHIDRAAVAQWATDSHWLGLNVISHKPNRLEPQARASVEFAVSYQDAAGQPQIHRELSQFRKEEGRWYFVDGEEPEQHASPSQQAAPGRNSPCPCGSGKKYKRCCGA